MICPLILIKILGNDSATLPILQLTSWDTGSTYTDKFVIRRDGLAIFAGVVKINDDIWTQDTGNNSSLRLNITDNTGELKIAKDGSVATDFSIKLQNSAGSIVTPFSIDTSQNVGIGTASPQATLSVSSTIGTTTVGATNGLTIQTAAGSTNYNSSLGFHYAGDTTVCPVSLGYQIISNAGYTKGDLWFATRDVTTASTPTERMRIKADGKVGIGTASPASLLHLSDSAVELRMEASGGSQASRLRMINNPGGNWYVGAGAYDGGSNLQLVQGSATGGINITTAGLVGIGTTSPSYKLEVNGTFYSAGSSEIYKSHITDLEIDSSLIYSLRPVSYDYKKEYKDFGYNVVSGKQVGLISEEVAEIIPELAIMKDGKPKNVDYQKLSVLLLKEVQNLKKEIEELKI